MDDEENIDVFEVLFEAVGAFEFELDFSAGRLLGAALALTAVLTCCCCCCCWFGGLAEEDDDEITDVAFCEKTEKAAAAALALACALEAIELAFL